MLYGIAALRPCVKARGPGERRRAMDPDRKGTKRTKGTKRKGVGPEFGRLRLRRRDKRAPGGGPAFTKASAVAYKAMADKPAGKHSCPHGWELITFPRGGKTDWGKKRRILEDLFWPQIDGDWHRYLNITGLEGALPLKFKEFKLQWKRVVGGPPE